MRVLFMRIGSQDGVVLCLGAGDDIFVYDISDIGNARITDFAFSIEPKPGEESDKIRIDTANANEKTWRELGFSIILTDIGNGNPNAAALVGSDPNGETNILYINDLLVGVSGDPGDYINAHFDTIFDIV